MDAADPLHARAKKVIEDHRTYPFFASDHVLSETVTLLRRELGQKPATEFGREFLEGKIGHLVQVDKTDWQRGFEIIDQFHEQKVSAADATSVAIIRRLDLEKVASFDKHFRIILVERKIVG